MIDCEQDSVTPEMNCHPERNFLIRKAGEETRSRDLLFAPPGQQCPSEGAQTKTHRPHVTFNLFSPDTGISFALAWEECFR